MSLPAIFQINTYRISSKVTLLMALWLASSCLSTLIGDNPWPAMVRWFEILTNCLIGLCLYLLIHNKPELKPLVIKAVIAALLLCVIVFVLFWHLSPAPEQHNWTSDIPFFLNIRHFSYLAAAALPFGYWLLENNEYKNRIAVVILYLSICWGLIFWLGGRAAFLGVITATFIYFILSRTHIKSVLLSILIGLLLSQLFIAESANLNMFRLFDLFLNSESKDLNNHSSFRMKIYLESIQYWWQEVPFLGIGADGYRYITPAIAGLDNITHPHSIFIQLLLSFGIPGAIIPMYLFLLLTYSIFKKQANLTITEKILYLPILSSIVSGMFNGIFYHAYGLFISTIILAICIPSYTGYNRQVHSNTISSKKVPSIITLLTLITGLYYLIFSAQLYASKIGCTDKNWINWNAKYPLYFSPNGSYSRYSEDDIEDFKKSYYRNYQNRNCIAK
ncbi:MAG: O-antigen ligase family protein [Oleispira sp.]